MYIQDNIIYTIAKILLCTVINIFYIFYTTITLVVTSWGKEHHEMHPYIPLWLRTDQSHDFVAFNRLEFAARRALLFLLFVCISCVMQTNINFKFNRYHYHWHKPTTTTTLAVMRTTATRGIEASDEGGREASDEWGKTLETASRASSEFFFKIRNFTPTNWYIIESITRFRWNDVTVAMSSHHITLAPPRHVTALCLTLVSPHHPNNNNNNNNNNNGRHRVVATPPHLLTSSPFPCHISTSHHTTPSLQTRVGGVFFSSYYLQIRLETRLRLEP